MCNFTATNVPLTKNTAKMDVEANAIKSVLTDYMQKASQSLLQLTGAKGYRLDHIAGRSTVDSRPFQIFEGSNDILYQQISESIMKAMRKVKSTNLYDFLKGYDLTIQSSDYFKDVLNFEIDTKTLVRNYGCYMLSCIIIFQVHTKLQHINTPFLLFNCLQKS